MECNLVLNGSGARGLFSFLGAYSVLEDGGYKTKKIVGAGAGAVIGALINVGYSSSTIKEFLIKLSLSDMREWLDNTIGHTYGDLTVIATDLVHMKSVKINTVNEMPVVDAVLRSFSMPKPFEIEHDRCGRIFTDGSLMDDYDLSEINNDNHPTFYMELFSGSRSLVNDTTLDDNMFHALYNLVILNQELKDRGSKITAQSILIPTLQYKPTDSLSIEDKILLYELGKSAAIEFLETWNYEMFKKVFCYGR